MTDLDLTRNWATWDVDVTCPSHPGRGHWAVTVRAPADWLAIDDALDRVAASLLLPPGELVLEGRIGNTVRRMRCTMGEDR